MKTTCSIRKMQESDIKDLSQGFINQGWPGREEILARYFLEQADVVLFAMNNI